MYPQTHFLFGLVFSLIFFIFVPEAGILGAGLIFLSSFLIDIDHYFYFIYKKRSFNLKKAYKWFINKGKYIKKLTPFERKEISTGFYCFHGIEIIFVLIILGLLTSKYFFYVAIGAILHLTLDWIKIIAKKERVFKISLIYDYNKNKELKVIW